MNVVFLDLSYIFDTVCHRSLLNKLPTCEELVASGQQLASGVSQTSILGTVLFSIFINDLYAKPEWSFGKFTNDTYLGGTERTGLFAEGAG